MSLDLDKRQRAMLKEMHVPVWWPQAHAPVLQDEPLPVAVMAPVLRAEAKPLPTTATAVAHAAAAHARAEQPAATSPAARTTPDTEGLITPNAHRVPVDAMNWAELAAAVSVCTACTLCIGRKAPVFAAEPNARQADWLIVGEPPDELEERAGVPFADQAGQLLDNMLRAVQLARDGTGNAGARITNVVKCRTAPVRNPQAEELATCAAYLRREIALVRPKVILAMGRFAALSLLAESSPDLASLPFGKLRGQVFRYQSVPVVVTYHPSRLLRAQEDKAGAWADLCLAQRCAQGLMQDHG